MLSSSMLASSRLVLRRWREEDWPAFAALNADSRVMEYFARPLERAESDAQAQRIDGYFARQGFGKWAVEAIGVADFIGYVGLAVVDFDVHFAPATEIGWRLAYEHWGHGYATEAARLALAFAFEELQLTEVVSFTVPENLRSRRVMERLGMTHDAADDFDHPKLPAGDRLRRHVLYRLSRAAWAKSRISVP
jgi:RimJ/RimL family protein N-acetyltransferase